MKKQLIFSSLALLIALLPTHWATAGGNLRSSLSQQWKQVQASQKSQQKKFRALERELEQLTTGRDTKKDIFQTSPSGSSYQHRW